MIHIIIKTERRKDRLAIAIGTQLHTQGSVINDWTNIAYAAEWDGKAPWITVLAGDRSTLKHQFMGWPTLTEVEWDAANPPGQFIPSSAP